MHNIFIIYSYKIIVSKQITIGHAIKASWHTISRMYNSYSNHYGISISYAYVLLALSTKKGKPSTQIAPELGMESRSITRLLKNMEDEGYIKKCSDLKDRRQVHIFLTDEGQKKRVIAKEIVKNFNNLLEQEIPENHLEVFFNVLEKVNRLAEQNHLNKDENI